MLKNVKVNPLMHDVNDPSFKRHNHMKQNGLRDENITWLNKNGNIIHSDIWNERATA